MGEKPGHCLTLPLCGAKVLPYQREEIKVMFKSMSYNTTNVGSSMNESSCAASRFARLSMDTVIAVSIFAILGLVRAIIILAELNVIVLAILSLVVILVSVLLAVVIINSNTKGRLNVVKA
jgi:asparagine N-glycosylation enzyme membrane subunit Stt3